MCQDARLNCLSKQKAANSGVTSNIVLSVQLLPSGTRYCAAIYSCFIPMPVALSPSFVLSKKAIRRRYDPILHVSSLKVQA